MPGPATGALGSRVPEPRDAATVCLLRDRPTGLEVFMLRRPDTMRFAPGVHVFPGGAVEDDDARVPVAVGADWSALGVRAATDRPVALVAAAVRETFEECGVLLAGPRRGHRAPSSDVLAREHVELCEGRVGFAELLTRYALVLDPSLLPLMSHWITPEVESRRFDTRFFTAALPPGQQASATGPEATGSDWHSPALALAAHAAGEFPMWPPTVATLQWLATLPDVASALPAARDAVVRPVMPLRSPDAEGHTHWGLVDHRTGVVLAPEDTSVTWAAALAAPPGPSTPSRP